MEIRELLSKAQTNSGASSQRELAKIMNLNNSSLSLLASGKGELSDDTYVKLAKLAGVDPVPLIKSICICKAMRLHPYLETRGDPFVIAQHRRFALQYFARHLRHLAFHRAIEDFDAQVNDYWQRQQVEAFALELMEEGA